MVIPALETPKLMSLNFKTGESFKSWSLQRREVGEALTHVRRAVRPVFPRSLSTFEACSGNSVLFSVLLGFMWFSPAVVSIHKSVCSHVGKLLFQKQLR